MGGSWSYGFHDSEFSPAAHQLPHDILKRPSQAGKMYMGNSSLIGEANQLKIKLLRVQPVALFIFPSVTKQQPEAAPDSAVGRAGIRGPTLYISCKCTVRSGPKSVTTVVATCLFV